MNRSFYLGLFHFLLIYVNNMKMATAAYKRLFAMILRFSNAGAYLSVSSSGIKITGKIFVNGYKRVGQLCTGILLHSVTKWHKLTQACQLGLIFFVEYKSVEK